MSVIKNLLPILILLALSIYSYQRYDQLPQVILNGIIFLPVVLAALVFGLSIHFNRSSVFFYVLLIATANIVLGKELAQSSLSYALLSAFLPLLLLVLTVLPDRGIFSIRAIPAYVILFSAIGFSIVAAKVSPGWLNHILMTDWLPARYFDWTQQSQSILFISVAMSIAMLVLYFLRPSPHMSAGLGVLIMLIVQLHFGDSDSSLNVFSSTALLMCLYAVLQESWRMAYLDELTELPARRALREKFQKMSGTYTVAMLDVDHFKRFNDTYGHDTGDAVLRMIATKMNRVSGGGACYRYGGEEFSVIFNGKDNETAIPHLEQLRETIASTPFVINRASRRKSDNRSRQKKKKSVKVTVSIGVADSTSAASSPWDVLKQADKALYRAKSKGRNRVCD
ncbi:MAG: GGDEF domain-containing protein [Gammaproteobacteria bacterium]|nr:GGDEF domain-containing protein [Gammaproteobacteria bacterium]MBT8133331.1 GGDEF domain-containing protein [Gammaproteobacteria bacterium]NNJ50380.1 GGDEF domain-containing protein [Gammaproteobacteria bacterium]